MELLSALIILFFVSVINSQTNPSTLTFNVQVYDQFPGYNNNFEATVGIGRVTGLVKSTLNTTTRVPELVSLSTGGSNYNGAMVSPELFKYFFEPQQDPSLPGYNFPLNFNLEFTYDPSRDVYFYDNQNYFPVDYQGFDTDPSKRIYSYYGLYHNYHFCMKMNTVFTFKGYEVFNFQGDDDVWVYINNQLVIDIGGVHGPIAASVDTATLGLTIGNSYNFDFFFCERQTVGSTIKIETNLELVCPFHDYCGVCQGDGSSCCNPQTTCSDNNECTIDSCPPADTDLAGLPISAYCTHTPKVDPNTNIDICFNRECNSVTGSFDPIPIPCLDRSSECLSTIGCNSTVGCQYENNCLPSSNPCISRSCDSTNGQCVETPIPGDVCDCGCGELQNKCMVSFCTPEGVCQPKYKSEIDDNNPCTLDFCDPCTGVISHTTAPQCLSCIQCSN